MITKIYNIKSFITYDTSIKDVVIKKLDSILLKGNQIYKINYNNNNNDQIDNQIDAKNNIITPGFIDSHTHMIFSSHRANDFSKRISGKTYLDIAKSGGGIKSSINSLRNSSKDELFNKC
ncbi:uncharacterized protein METZ01_LOCUS348531, partial [marine metagenome]